MDGRAGHSNRNPATFRVSENLCILPAGDMQCFSVQQELANRRCIQ